MRVLVIDDNVDFAESMAMLLAVERHESFVCTISKDALTMIESLRPDVVMLDLAMPGLDGFQIAQQLRDRDDLRPRWLIAVSGYTDELHRARVAKAGFDEYLLKPVDVPQLKALLAQGP